MKVSYNWLKELVNLKDISYDKLVNDMSLYSIEVESTGCVTSATGIVVGYVESKEKHPNADKLSVCMVNTGSDVRQIVCGAPNVEAGLYVMVALPGAKLPGGEIKEGVIRGIESKGMLCSLAELGLDSKFIPEEFAHGIYILDDSAPLGMDATEYLNLNDKYIELGLTPNRMDLLSMYGVARDVSAMYDRETYIEYGEIHESDKLTTDEISVELNTPNCVTYNARVIKNVKINESPNFIKARLIAAGIRPINNVVDITNYILMLFGQPLHAFDQDKLGNKIVVRNAKENETCVSLDDITRVLKENDIVITDGTKPVCIAGVMGCANTEVTSDTKNIVLEAAVFNSLLVRKTSNRLNLRSESSVRYERGVDLNNTQNAMNYACYLLEKYAGGEILKGICHSGCNYIQPDIISINSNDLKRYLGIEISTDKIIDICHRLDFETELKENYVNVSVPNRRMDVHIKCDLVEEIARINGYDKLKETLPIMDISGGLTVQQAKKRIIKHTLCDLGLREIYTYSLVSSASNKLFPHLLKENAQEIVIKNPLSEEKAVPRMSIIPSLLDNIKYNCARKNKDISIFELSSRYYYINDKPQEDTVLSGALTGEFFATKWLGNKGNIDFYTVKGILEILFKKLGVNITYKKLLNTLDTLHPERTAGLYYNDELIGFLGEVHPAYTHKEDLNDVYVFEIVMDKILNKEEDIISFSNLPKVPLIERDIALVMDENKEIGDLIDGIYRVDKKLITKVEVFDIYKGENIGKNEKSVAFRITFEPMESITEDVINEKMQKIIKMAEYCHHATIRS